MNIENLNFEFESKILALKKSATELRSAPTQKKKALLVSLAQKLQSNVEAILRHNQEDFDHLSSDVTTAFRDRLKLTPERITQMSESLHQVAEYPDPVNELVEERNLENGLKIKKVRAPLGIIFMIFESRPNVITEAFSLALLSGNALILRGGKESAHTARFLYELIQLSAIEVGFENRPMLGIEDYNRTLVAQLLRRPDLIDIAVPRGGEKLIQFVQETALVPIIKNDRGLCHLYIDDSANLDWAINIAVNAKTQRPGVCNSIETILVHQKIAKEILPRLFESMPQVEWFLDPKALAILSGRPRVQLAKNISWDTEYLDYKVNCKIVENLDEALWHIAQFGSKHSESIVTTDTERAQKFLNDVDAAAVYWNASTRFTDGFSLGLGGELGISTQKLHVRGPVGPTELTTPRWVIVGEGTVRT